MPEYQIQIRGQFLCKPECIDNFPEWMLSKEQIKAFRNMKTLAIVEMAGRDSVAAAIKSVQEKGFTDLLPTYVYTVTEHGNWKSVPEAVARLKQRLSGDIRIHELLVFGSPGFWQALNGRYVSELIERYGFYTPCIGCHIYLHSARIPLSALLGNKPVITGERESHDGGEKINQIPEVLDAYEAISQFFNVPILMPLRYIKEGTQIEKILGMRWEQDRDQLGCILSGNYRDTEGKNKIKREDVKRFLEGFALPFTRQIIKSYLEGYVPDHKEMAKRMLDTGKRD